MASNLKQNFAIEGDQQKETNLVAVPFCLLPESREDFFFEEEEKHSVWVSILEVSHIKPGIPCFAEGLSRRPGMWIEGCLCTSLEGERALGCIQSYREQHRVGMDGDALFSLQIPTNIECPAV